MDLPDISSLNELLRIDREEVRFWQQQFIQASYLYDAAALAVAAYLLRQRRLGAPILVVALVGVLLLCGSYQWLAWVTKESIGVNHRDLARVEAELNFFPIYSDQGRSPDSSPVLLSWLPEPIARRPLPAPCYPLPVACCPPSGCQAREAVATVIHKKDPGPGVPQDWIQHLRLLNVVLTVLVALVAWLNWRGLLLRGDDVRQRSSTV